jgi:U3 small nucleolar ribonucleoprotein protein IMP4
VLGGKDLVLDEAQRGELNGRRERRRRGVLMRCAEPGSHIDDEYARVGLYEPKIVITTSRDPSSRLLQFAKVRSPRSVLD